MRCNCLPRRHGIVTHANLTTATLCTTLVHNQTQNKATPTHTKLANITFSHAVAIIKSFHWLKTVKCIHYKLLSTRRHATAEPLGQAMPSQPTISYYYSSAVHTDSKTASRRRVQTTSTFTFNVVGYSPDGYDAERQHKTPTITIITLPYLLSKCNGFPSSPCATAIFGVIFVKIG